MNLKPVTPNIHTGKPDYLMCCQCHKFKPLAEVLADLDGEPFKAYHCFGCLAPKQTPKPDGL